MDTFKPLSDDELSEIDGGSLLVVGAVILVGVCVIAFGIGVYNGYQGAGR